MRTKDARSALYEALPDGYESARYDAALELLIAAVREHAIKSVWDVVSDVREKIYGIEENQRWADGGHVALVWIADRIEALLDQGGRA